MQRSGQIITWVLISTFFLLENVTNFSLTVIKSDLQNALSLSEEEFAYLASAFILSYSLFMIPAGILLDRLSMRLMVPLSLLVFSLSCFGFGLSQNFHMLIVCRIFMGMSASFSLLSSLKYARSFFNNKLGFFSGMGLSFGMVGAIFSKAPTYYLYDVTGHEKVYIFSFFALLGFILALCLKFLLCEKADSHQDPYSLVHVKEVAVDRGFWYIALYGALMYTPFLVLEMAWLKDFLTLLIQSASQDVINQIESAPFMGVIIGSIVFGYVSDRARDRKFGLLISALLSAITLELFFLGLSTSIVYNFVLLFFFGFATGGFMPSFAYLAQRYDVEVAGCAMGMMNFINMLGGSFVLPILGRKIDYLSSHSTLSNFEIYQMTLLFLPIATVCAAFLIGRVKKPLVA